MLERNRKRSLKIKTYVIGRKRFKTKNSLYKYILANIDTLYGEEVATNINTKYHSYYTDFRRISISYNPKSKVSYLKLVKIGNSKIHSISKEIKRKSCYTDKIINLMCSIASCMRYIDSSDEYVVMKPIKSKMNKLINLFNKSIGNYKFSNEELNEIDTYLDDMTFSKIDFFHKSDRCDFIMMMIIIKLYNRDYAKN